MMKARYKTAIFLLILIVIIWKVFEHNELLSFQEHSQDAKQPAAEPTIGENAQTINVSIYYEALCSDSRNFILKQLLPTYTALSKYMRLNLIPYGKAKTITSDDGKIEFKCQHGSTECLGNKIHSCSVDLISDASQRLNMVACMIDDNMIPFEAAERCANRNNVDFEQIVECTNSYRSSILLREFGEETQAVRPSITFIPTVVFNNSQKTPLSEILKDFKQQICNSFSEKPRECL